MAKRALISVSDKSGVAAFAKALIASGYEIISTGGTLRALRSSGVEAIEVSDLTGYGELFGGRVKTLHPVIHGGVLFRRDNEQDCIQAGANGVAPIDLVCVNLYPFKATTKRTDDLAEIIENIDIGGPALIRAAAKNFASVIVATDPSDYEAILDALANGDDGYEFRAALMVKAYEHTARYDATIAGYMGARFGLAARSATIAGSLAFPLRYGENPHQKGFLYQFDDFYSNDFKVLRGEASFNNLTDASAAIKIARAFGESAICIVKHGNPCGFSLRENLCEAWDEALRCDSLSAFGGVVAINGAVDEALALKISKMFIEAIIAPSFSEAALGVFAAKKRLKLFKAGEGDRLSDLRDKIDFKHILGGFVLQESDEASAAEIDAAKVVTRLAPSEAQKADLRVAWLIAALTKSNCVAYVKDRTLVAIGMGMTSRVDSALAAMRKAETMGCNIRGASMASEAFFPFRDSIDAASLSGVAAIAQTGGSARDQEVIDAANEHNIAMVFTGVRHFLH
ncbi:MAG: bifunctional phosphoribosylaminoimidazolecarboxamide formyltransferase/IMP cyclohydrolase [Helicobacteraceae bacterium]|jgi:phosphoribosylaminoimidazolecarboxamide formyltransferase/IMP cyclohydrolase|nr:bifunctional phosphoribosylaminoimidazolecarboxamide formyltransferase/IMP cyclohydrolase [Helicobacteraceae bacterium]